MFKTYHVNYLAVLQVQRSNLQVIGWFAILILEKLWLKMYTVQYCYQKVWHLNRLENKLMIQLIMK